MPVKGVIAAGHPVTAEAAEYALRAGGNAFDAIVAAHFAACIAEPVLASLGGGGFMLASREGDTPRVYDFFVQTPRTKRNHEALDFRPIIADFGTAQQEFHIGQGTIATPGAVRGMFEIHRDLCTLPLRELVTPAIQYAREGVVLNELQAYIFDIVKPIYSATPEAMAIFGSKTSKDGLLREGEVFRQPAMADTLDVLASEGADLFYRGEIATAIVKACREDGGHLTIEDLESYQPLKRKALEAEYHDWRIFTNPPPSSGGVLIAFGAELLKDAGLGSCTYGSHRHLKQLTEAMARTNEVRSRLMDTRQLAGSRNRADEYLSVYQGILERYAEASRGTTHISVIDMAGNAASMTVSNGEGCGYIVPDTGIMLNNMLGEQDLSPQGFHEWTPDRRMTSMMAPTFLVSPDGTRVATGSGGSNRIRTALLQVLLNLMDFGMDLEAAVRSPRIHLEGDKLSIEGGFNREIIARLIEDYPLHETWPGVNLFFGGAHTVMQGPGGYAGVGDPRRGGVCVAVG